METGAEQTGPAQAFEIDTITFRQKIGSINKSIYIYIHENTCLILEVLWVDDSQVTFKKGDTRVQEDNGDLVEEMKMLAIMKHALRIIA
jgi:hypothetical protein